MRLSLSLSEFDHEVLHRPQQSGQVIDALSSLLYRSKTQEFEPMDDHILTFESSSSASKPLPKKEKDLGTLF